MSSLILPMVLRLLLAPSPLPLPRTCCTLKVYSLGSSRPPSLYSVTVYRWVAGRKAARADATAEVVFEQSFLLGCDTASTTVCFYLLQAWYVLLVVLPGLQGLA
jgi:hypothetical protein